MYILGFWLMKDPIKISTSCKNQVCTPHIDRVTYNLNSHNVCMLFNRDLIHAKLEFIKVLGRFTYNLNSHSCCMLFNRALMQVKIEI